MSYGLCVEDQTVHQSVVVQAESLHPAEADSREEPGDKTS